MGINGLYFQRFRITYSCGFYATGIKVKTAFFETMATALLIASEAFVVGFGAVWLALSSIVHYPAWQWPAIIAGLAAAVWSAAAVFRMAARAAANDRAFLARQRNSD